MIYKINEDISSKDITKKVKFRISQWLIGNTRKQCNSCDKIEYHSYDHLRGYTCECGANELMDAILKRYNNK
jgi:hypothetical protein